MTLAEFMDKLNELYVGNERDFGDRNVMVATDGTTRPFSELVMRPEAIVLCDKASENEGVSMSQEKREFFASVKSYLRKVAKELERMNKLKSLELKGRHDLLNLDKAVAEVMEDDL